MKTFLLSILSFCLANNTTAQDYPSDTSFISDQRKIRVRTEDIKGNFLLLSVYCNNKKALSDTIEKRGIRILEFIDFNKDKSEDILIEYFGNNPTWFLYLFDKKTNTFRTIKNYFNFPDAVQLKSNPKYYYSYYGSGCADLNWVSDLFVIENFKIVHKGHIYGKGCDFQVESNPQVIEIYKIIDNNEEEKKLIAKLPLIKYVPKFDDKWDFIEKYWNKNYFKFQ